MTLTSDTNFAAKSGEGMILIDEAQATEELAYSASKSGATLSTPLANRGLEGGSAQAHAINATVKGILTVDMWNDVIDSLLNILDQTTGAVKTGVGLTSPKITTGINDANDNELLKVTATASAVNELTLANAATGNNPILSATGGNDDIGIDLQAKGAGVYNFKSTASQASEIRLFEDTDAGSNYVAIKPPALAANYTLTLPTTDGSASQVLQTDGDGVLSWAANAATGFSSRARASLTGNQTITTATYTKVSLGTEQYDGDSEFDSATNYRFTATTTGYYQVNAAVFYDTPTAAKRYFILIYKDGSAYAQSVITADTTNQAVAPTVSDVVYLAANSYVELYTYHDKGTDDTVTAGVSQTFMSVHRLS